MMCCSGASAGTIDRRSPRHRKRFGDIEPRWNGGIEERRRRSGSGAASTGSGTSEPPPENAATRRQARNSSSEESALVLRGSFSSSSWRICAMVPASASAPVDTAAVRSAASSATALASGSRTPAATR